VDLGSARVSRVGESVSLSRTLGASTTIAKVVLARRVRPPGMAVLVLIAIVGLTDSLAAAEVVPPKPDRYFNDYAHIVSPGAALRFNQQLAQFERETSNQVLVAIYPKMQTDSDIADYTQRIAQTWGVGQKD